MKSTRPLDYLFLVKMCLLCVGMLLSIELRAQTDREFWFVAPNVYQDPTRDFNKPIVLRLTSFTTPATVTISMPADPSFTPIVRSVGANSTESVDLSASINKLQNKPANTTLNKGLLITSTADITAYYEVVSGCDCNPEIFSLKGKNALGNEFFISSQFTFDESTSYEATNAFDIVATRDGTHVTITPTKNIVGHAANVAFTITLNKGQTYSAQATGQSAGDHLQGSFVSADNPIAVTLKDDLVQISSCADLIGDQAVPISVLGTQYVVTKGYLAPNGSGQIFDYIYVTATENNTSVFRDGAAMPVAILQRGQSAKLDLSNASTYISSDKKIYVYHLTGNGCEAGSAVIPKLNCTGSGSVNVVRSKPDMFAVMITTKHGNEGGFTVNGNSGIIDANDFSPVPGTGDEYFTARINLSNKVSVGSPINFANSTGNFSLGFINGGTSNGTAYGYFSDYKSSNVQTGSIKICPSGTAQLSAYGGVAYKWTPATGLDNPNIANPKASPATTTDYTVEITTADGCVDYASVRVEVSNSGVPMPASVAIAATSTNVCAGSQVTFTATPTNGGTAPTYQWQVNGVNVGANNATFSSSTLANGDKITCLMTSNAPCATPTQATSNVLDMEVSSSVPSISIAASQNGICLGTPVLFTATIANGGTTPVYQWKVNGVNVGLNSPTFSSSTLVNNDNVTCTLTSNAPCAVPGTITSNAVNMVVNSDVVSISIEPSQNNLCQGTSITFTATITGGGVSPVYQWKINDVNTGANSPLFNSSALVNGDKVTCTVTSNAPCAVMPSVTSNQVTIATKPYVTPTVAVSQMAGNLCQGDIASFTATVTNGGANPSYQWQVNGINAGGNTSILSIGTLANGDVVRCIVVSDGICTINPVVNSNPVTVVLNSPVTPAITIAASDNNVCAGSPVTFAANVLNGGSNPTYQWLVNGHAVGQNSSSYQSNTFVNGDVVTCRLTSSDHCVLPATVESSTINMIINPLPVVDAGGDKTIEKGASVALSASATGNIDDITWSPSTGLSNSKVLNPMASPAISTTYRLTIRTTSGCIDMDEMKVTVLTKLVIPNTFSPNGDGINDYWVIKNFSDYPGATLEVFTRWGQSVYRSKQSSPAWNGTYNGKQLPAGVYYYVIHIDNDSSPFSGTITLIR
ncbi:MAG: gliding motility-associated C-terminal domain-containing protein [Mucilaginibacter sp.]|nr:gliding motility-associated C-terminal domain-containing protein [Mucilaginibacter sp.]